MDVKLAYLHRVLDEEIYMEQPEGFIAKGGREQSVQTCLIPLPIETSRTSVE